MGDEPAWKTAFPSGVMPDDSLERRQRYCMLRLWDFQQRAEKATRDCLEDPKWASGDKAACDSAKARHLAIGKYLSVELAALKDERRSLGVDKGSPTERPDKGSTKALMKFMREHGLSEDDLTGEKA